VVKVVTLLVTPPDAEKLTLASREGTLRLAMRNYSDSKIVATNGIAMGDLMHNGAATVPMMQPQPVTPVGVSARPAHLTGEARTPLRVEVMRDGKSSEAISFLNSGRIRRSSDQSRDAAPAISAPLAPAAERAPDSSETPVSAASAGAAESLAGAGENEFAASRAAPSDDHASVELEAPIKPGEPGYQPAPKTYEVR
jgi:hypothetical protein